jgi:phage shock protein C
MPTKSTKTKPTQQKVKSNRLYRSESDRMLAGVCGGIAEYFGIDSSIVRLIFIGIILLGGSGVIFYLVLWLVLPSKSDKSKEVEEIMKKNTAELKNTAESVAKEAREMSHKSGKSVWGLFLIGFGLVLLLQNFGFAHYLMLDKTWPVILVVLGFLALGK